MSYYNTLKTEFIVVVTAKMLLESLALAVIMAEKTQRLRFPTPGSTNDAFRYVQCELKTQPSKTYQMFLSVVAVMGNWLNS